MENRLYRELKTAYEEDLHIYYEGEEVRIINFDYFTPDGKEIGIYTKKNPELRIVNPSLLNINY